MDRQQVGIQPLRTVVRGAEGGIAGLKRQFLDNDKQRVIACLKQIE